MRSRQPSVTAIEGETPRPADSAVAGRVLVDVPSVDGGSWRWCTAAAYATRRAKRSYTSTR